MKNKINIYVTKTYKSIGSEIIQLLDLIDIQCKIYVNDLNFKQIKKTYKNEYNLIIYPYNKIVEYDDSKIENASFFLYLLEYYDFENEILQSFINKSIHTFYVNDYKKINTKKMTRLPIPIHEINEVYDYDIIYYGKITDRINEIYNELLLNFNIHLIDSEKEDVIIEDYLSKSQILLLLNDDHNLINEFSICQALKHNIHVIIEKNDNYLTNNDFIKQYRNNIHFLSEITSDNIESIKRYLQNFIINKNNISNFVFLNTFSPHLNININFTNIHEFALYYKYNDIYRCINDIKHDKKIFHRFNCYNTISSIKNIKLEPFDENSDNESVLVEFRSFPHLEFLLRNTIYKLGPKWKHTIVCGNINYNMINKICENIGLNINIIKLNFSHVTRRKYCEIFLSKDFWELFTGNKLLVYQEDTCIFKKNIDDFIEYDYVGAPWPKHQRDNLMCVGNGGFSLRSKNIMIEVIEKVDPSSIDLNQNTMDYIKRTKLDFIPEDVYFTKSMIDHKIGVISPWDNARSFSQESVESNDPFAGHCFWNCNDKHKVISLLSSSQSNLYKLNTMLLSIVNNFNKENIIQDILNTHKIVFVEDVCSYFLETTHSLSTQWIGFFTTFNHTNDTLDKLFKNDIFVKSLNKCKGIITYHKKNEQYCNNIFTKYSLPVKILNIKLPCNIIETSFDEYVLNDLKIYYIGCSSEDNIQMFHTLKTHYDKHILLIDYESQHIITNEFTYKINESNIILDIENSKHSFIEKIKSNILFIYAEELTKTDKISLFIEYNIPFFINKTSSAIEYLGNEYPLYYENTDDIQHKINNENIINVLKDGYNYLVALNKQDMSFEYFNSEIMKFIN